MPSISLMAMFFIVIVFSLFSIYKVNAEEIYTNKNQTEIKDIKLVVAQEAKVEIQKSEILSLKDAIDIAMENNHHVKSAIATLPIAEAQLIIAKYRPNPVVGANSEIVSGGSTHPLQVGGQIEIGRKRYWRIKVAKEEISKRELEIAKVLWEIHTEVHSTYAALSAGLKLFELAKERKDFYVSLLDVAQKRYQAGDISMLELERAKIELLRAENDLADFDERLKRAKVDFNHILGREAVAEVVLEDPEKLKPKIKLDEYDPLENVLNQALNKRLEMAILEKDFGITRAKLKKAFWEKIPNLYIEGGPARPNYHSNVWGPYVGAQVEVPIFNRKQGEITEAKAQVEYLQKEKERIQHDIAIDVANSLRELEVREKQVGNFEGKLLSESENIIEMIRMGYKRGKLSFTDVLNSEQQNRDIKVKYIESLLNYQLALAELEYAVGIPLYGLSEKL